jgi:peptidoglycan/LPS O-acetylase OafA/YrhL
MNPDSETSKGQLLGDLQGLRALAVLLVLGFHLWPDAVPGGYIGVDIFFVISGYLMTDILLRDYRRSGTIDISGFFIHRLRRIFPAAALVVILVALFSPMLPATRWGATYQEIVASALFLQNWLLASRAVDYLAADDAMGILQHYWSLGVEVQFYVVWPLLLVAVIHLGIKAGFRIGSAVVVAVALVAIASLVFSVIHTEQNPARAYFATEVRVWEFAIGGLIAAGNLRGIFGQRIGTCTQLAGLGAITFAAFVFTSQTSFPGYAALLPCVGAALIVIGREGSLLTAILSSKPSMFVGDNSYSIYLWHWPLIIFWTSLSPETYGTFAKCCIILMTFIFAGLSKFLVEDPFRRKREVTWTQSSVVLGVAITAIATASALIPVAMSLRHYQQDIASVVSTDAYPGAIALVERVKYDQTLPPLPGPVLAKKDYPVALREHCHILDHGEELPVCEFGNIEGSIHFAVVGDSHAAVMSEPLKLIAEGNGWRYTHMTKANCPFAMVRVTNAVKSRIEDCARWNQQVLTHIREIAPDFVFTAQSTKYWPVGAENRILADEGIQEGLTRRWAELGDLGVEVVAMRDFPLFDFVPPDCVAEGRDNCNRPRKEVLRETEPAVSAAIHANVPFVDLSDGICRPATCRMVEGNVFVWRDASHLTATYARTLAPLLEQQLKNALLEKGVIGKTELQ